MKHRPQFILGLALLASAVAGAGCHKSAKTDEAATDVILTNEIPVTSPASEPKAEVTIAGVSHDEERSLIDLLHVTGLLTRGTQQVAIINGSVVSMGEDMHLDANGHPYKLKVLSIKGTVIKLKAELDEAVPL